MPNGFAEQDPTDPGVEGFPLLRRAQLVGRLVNPIVKEPKASLPGVAELIAQKPIARVERHQNALAQGLPDPRPQVGAGPARDLGQHAEAPLRADARAERQHLARGIGQPAKPGDDQIDDVVGGDRRRNLGFVPDPPAAPAVERQDPLGGQRGQELLQEEGVAGGLLEQHRRQRTDLGRLQPQGLAEQRDDVVEPQRGQHHLVDGDAGLGQLLAHGPQQLRLAAAVVAVGADDQHMRRVPAGEQLAQQAQRGRIRPLQIVEKQRQRVLRASKRLDELAEHQLEAGLRLYRADRRDGRLGADDHLQLRHQLRDQPSVSAQRLAQPGRPRGQLGR